jgi:DNA repair protein RadC
MHNKTNHDYPSHQPMSEHQILEKAADIISAKFIDKDAFTDVTSSKQFLTFKLAQHEREVFAVMILDNQNQLIEYKELFFGTVDSATVHPREVVKAVLALNGSGVILAHNHPSGVTEPSQADLKITQRLKDALALIDVRVLDHIVIGRNPLSFAERGLI